MTQLVQRQEGPYPGRNNPALAIPKGFSSESLGDLAFTLVTTENWLLQLNRSLRLDPVAVNSKFTT